MFSKNRPFLLEEHESDGAELLNQHLIDPDQWQQLLPASLDAAYSNSAFLSTVR